MWQGRLGQRLHAETICCAGAGRERLSGGEPRLKSGTQPKLPAPAMTLYPSSKSNAGFIECLHHSGFEGALLPSRGIPQFKRVEFHVGSI